MNFFSSLKPAVVNILQSVYQVEVLEEQLVIDICKKEFGKQFTLLTFPFARLTGKSPEMIANELGIQLTTQDELKSFSVVKGFLNFDLPDNIWYDIFSTVHRKSIHDVLRENRNVDSYLIEFCSPNTNKPLHLGHIRNILLGWSVKTILQELGQDVLTTQIINDRGIAICKSMVAWLNYAHGATPDTSHQKGDHFVGDLYVAFEKHFKEEYSAWQQTDTARNLFLNISKTDSETEFFKEYKNEYFNKYSILGKQAKDLLLLWEKNDTSTIDLWQRMNNWVYVGFDETLKRVGIHIDTNYYESDTYLLGKEIIDLGLNSGVFYRETDKSVWIDLQDVGLDKKVVLRSDGTSMYITQDLGTAELRNTQHGKNNVVYVVGDEQDYHFKVLFEILKKLNRPYAKGLFHLSYGMVELPTGRMKSREGTVVDADDLIDEIVSEAAHSANERGELVALNEEEKSTIFYQIGMAALKYFILKVHPRKKMIFDPSESLDMQGHTGPYIVNAFVRMKSILRKSSTPILPEVTISSEIHEQEKVLIYAVSQYRAILDHSAQTLDPSHLANFLYQLAKDFHKYYHECRILNAETDELKQWRLSICYVISLYLEHGMRCLGISMPDKM